MSRRDSWWLLLVVPGVFGVATLGGSQATWFPQQYSREFYIAKGILGIAAVLLILIHMSTTWPHVGSRGQQLRYIALLGVTTLIASGSKAQFGDSSPVEGRNIGALLAVLVVIAAMAVSIQYDRRHHKH